MKMTKVRLGIIGVIVVASVAILLAIHNHSQVRLRNEGQALRQKASQPARATAEGIFARGQISKTIYSARQAVQTEEKFNFQFQLIGNRWLAKTEPLALASPNESIVTASDGTDVFTLFRLKRIIPGVPKGSWPPGLEANISEEFLDMIEHGHTNSRPNGEIFCCEGKIPQVEPGLAAPLWLALGSGAYFEMQAGVTSAPCLWMPLGDGNSQASIVVARGDTARGAGGLPMHLIFGPFLGAWSGGNTAAFEKEGSRSDLATAEYTVLASTNVDGKMLPTRFTLVRFFSQGRNSTGTRAVRSEVSGIVTAASTHASNITMPSPEPGFTVVEKRLPKDGPLMFFKYVATGSNLWSLDEITNSAKFKDAWLKTSRARSALGDANRRSQRHHPSSDS
jgi:hypothetical protein